MPLQNTSLENQEKIIIQKIILSQTELFEELMKKYQKPIYFYLFKLFNGNVADTEDTTAETFSKAYLKITSFKSSFKFSSWLYRITHNVAIDLIRKNKNYYVWGIEKLEKIPVQKVNLSLEYNLDKILNFLKPTDRSILTMKYLDELSS